MSHNPYESYVKHEVEGADKGGLLLLLYDGVVKFLNVAKLAMEKDDIEGAHINIVKAENIIYELIATLNMDEGGEVAKNLMRVYEFMIFELENANIEKSIEKVDSVLKLTIALRDAWRQIVNGGVSEAKQPEEGHVKPINISG